jgi:hypothetical protein
MTSANVPEKALHSKWMGRLRPLRQRLRRGHETARTALARVMDATHAEALLQGLCSMKLSRCESSREDSKVRHYRDGSVGRHGKRFTARVRLDARARRGEDAPEVVGPVLLLLHILDHMCLHERNQEYRAWTKALWLGKQHRGTDQQPHHSLSRALGVSVRELQRWLAALRTLGVVKNWQPRVDEKTPANARTRKGRAYSCYLLGELGETWSDYQRGLRKEAAMKAHTKLSTNQESANEATSPAVQPGSPSGGMSDAALWAKLNALIPDPPPLPLQST